MPQSRSAVQYRFAGFELRPYDRMLVVAGRPAAVTPRAFDVLVALVERAGGLVTKAQLLDEAWPNLVVEENNLQVQISTLRKIVGHEAIQTVAGRGYRFTPPVDVVRSDAPTQQRPPGLPYQATSFVGREDDVRRCIRLLASTRLLTLVGVGGIGKTRLSLALATAVSDGFSDGVAFVDLSPLDDPRLVPDAVASSLGVKPQSGSPLLYSLLQQVSARHQLVILDNCEHLVAACADLAGRLLMSGPKLRLVVTSRERLHAVGEIVYDVPSLAAPGGDDRIVPESLSEYSAAKLFVERTAAVRGEFAVTPENAPYIVRICRDLDGIPLALELAAGRVRAMSVKAIAEHLDERFRLLVGGGALARQQTLRATLDWSYELLTDPERALLRRLSVFAGGFEIDAAQAVGSGDDARAGEVLYLLADLVDKCLVVFEPDKERYRLLETVRQYARERLVEAEGEARVRDEHLRFYVSLAERTARDGRSARQAGLFARIGAERDNIVSAFAHARNGPAGASAGISMIEGLLGLLATTNLELSLQLAESALAHPDAQMEGSARSRALFMTAFMHVFAGRYEEARIKAKDSVRIARKCGDLRALAEGLYRLGFIELGLGRRASAGACFDEQLALGRRLDERSMICGALNGLGDVHSSEGRLEVARNCYLEALAQNVSNPDAVVTLHLSLTRNAIALGTETAAVDHLRDALKAMGTVLSIAYVQYILVFAGGIAAMRGDFTRAVRYFGVAAAHRERHGWNIPEPDASFVDRFVVQARDGAETDATEAFAAGRAVEAQAGVAEARAWVQALPA